MQAEESLSYSLKLGQKRINNTVAFIDGGLDEAVASPFGAEVLALA
jgi:hypothetical protein